jgi:hypothetical protein
MSSYIPCLVCHNVKINVKLQDIMPMYLNYLLRLQKMQLCCVSFALPLYNKTALGSVNTSKAIEHFIYNYFRHILKSSARVRLVP